MSKFVYKQLAKLFEYSLRDAKPGRTRRWLPKGYLFGTPWYGSPRLSAVQNKWDTSYNPEVDSPKKGRRLDSEFNKGYGVPDYYKTRYFKKTTTVYKQKGHPVKWHRYSVEEIDQLLPQFEDKLAVMTKLAETNAPDEAYDEHIPTLDEQDLKLANRVAPGYRPIFSGPMNDRKDFFIDQLHDAVALMKQSREDQQKWITIPNCPDHVPIDEWARRQVDIIADWKENKMPPKAGDIYREDNNAHTYRDWKETRSYYWDHDHEKFMTEGRQPFGIRRKIWKTYQEIYKNKPKTGTFEEVMSQEERESAERDLENVRAQREADKDKKKEQVIQQAGA